MALATKVVGGGMSYGTARINECAKTGTTTDLTGAGIFTVTVDIAAAAVATLRATPVELFPAPGAGYIAIPLGGLVFLNYTAPAYTESADNLVCKWVDGSGTACSEIVEMTGFITLTADAATNIMAVKDVIGLATVNVNKAIVLHNNGDGEFGNSGGSSLRVCLTVMVFPSGF